MPRFDQARDLPLVDMDWDDDVCDFTVARVEGNGSTRRAPFDQMREAGLVYESIGHFFTGRVDNRPLSRFAHDL